MKLNIIRKFFQFLCFALFTFFLWRATFPFEYAAGAKLFFAFDPLIALGVSIADRVFLAALIPAGIVLVLTGIFGRFFCGWICPMGAMIDFAGFIRCRFISRKKEVKTVNLFKFVLLAAIIIFAVFGIQYLWVVDPVILSGRFISMNLIPLAINGIDFIFKNLLKLSNFPEILLGLYRTVKGGVGAVRTEYFANALSIFLIWFFAVVLVLFSRRFWCRNLCPLGALLALPAKVSLYKRRVSFACAGCAKCIELCPMGAINNDNSYKQGECVLCMDCVSDCPPGSAFFSFKKEKIVENTDGSRRNFLKFAAISAVAVLGAKSRLRQREKEEVIRPPGALKEEDFVQRCVRCGNCMRACVTNGLQPVIFESGLTGIWTPHLVPEIGECEYNCNLCGKVCPTGAITCLSLEEKKMTRIGTAGVKRNICLPWIAGENCLVCEEYCPIEEKAIKLVKAVVNGKSYLRPVVDKGLCIGCGTCENVCPVRPARAITVSPSGAGRT